MKVIFTQGLPGSGKSTWTKKECVKNKDWVRVNRDDLRNMRGQYWIPKDEGFISDLELSCILTSLRHNKNVFVDATNFNKNHINNIKEEIIKKYPETKFETKVFDTPLEECIKRDLARPNSVGEKVIRGMYEKYLKPDNTIEQNTSLPHAVICDLDGTIAIHNGRSPFDYDKCDTDLINTPIYYVLDRLLASYDFTGKLEIIFMSGREDSCKTKTEKWLMEHGLPCHNLFMRKTGDWRKDTVIKKELFEEHIKDKYYVEFILDDRNCVVDMWRDLGLTCLQVAPGDF